ncbi:hypothetical protein D9M72_645600 [compost metagenome]
MGPIEVAIVMTSTGGVTFTGNNTADSVQRSDEVSVRRNSRRQVNSKLALRPCSRAIADADAPGCKLSSTSLAFNARS